MAYLFLSYGLENREDAQWLAEQLTAKGFDVWQDDGKASNQERLDALKEAQVFMVLMTPLASRSARVQRESTLAATLSKTVFPVLLRGDIFPEYRQLPYIDMREGLAIPGAMVKMLRAILTATVDEANIEDGEATLISKPKALRDLAKVIRTNFGGNQPRGVTQEMEKPDLEGDGT
jgi:hypothetical protein